MAEGDNMPSEDENFDVRLDDADSQPRRVVNMAPRRVSMSDIAPAAPAPATEAELTDFEREQQQAEQPAEPEAPAQEAAPEPAAPEAPVEAAPVLAAETPSEAEPAPVEQAQVTPAKAEKPAKVTKVKGPKTSRPVGRFIFEAVLVLALIAVSIYAYSLYSDRKDLKAQVSSLNANPQAVIQKQTQDLLGQVGQLVQLPSGETPTIALVSDANAARQQSAFFANAQNGDKVLMYVKAGEAILYRPSTNKIILVAPLTFSSAAASSTTSTTKQ